MTISECIGVIWNDGKYSQGNAALVAAAPEMYELLKRALPLLHEVGVHDHLADSDGAQELIKDIEKLIDGEER